ncbi:MAG: hypothetical protein V7678_10840, partial [Brevundimonas sp.]
AGLHEPAASGTGPIERSGRSCGYLPMTHHDNNKAAAGRRAGRLVPLIAALLLLAALAVLSFYFIARAWEDGEPGEPGRPPLAESPPAALEGRADGPPPA